MYLSSEQRAILFLSQKRYYLKVEVMNLTTIKLFTRVITCFNEEISNFTADLEKLLLES